LSCRIHHNDISIDNVIYPENARAIIDVTKPPYSLDNTGQQDNTEKLIRIYDDILRPTLIGFQETVKALEINPDTSMGFETNKTHGVIFPNVPPTSKIIYFPNGIYKVSNSIEYTFNNLKNSLGMELNRQIHFQGQSRAGTIIKLADHSSGFKKGALKPVINFMKGERSNVAMSNTFENITIDIGKGNPGAVGLRFFANNTGAVRNVTIRSSDPDHVGAVGLWIDKKLVSGCYFKNISVEGFNRGIEVVDFAIFTTFEHISLKEQQKIGFHIVDNVVSIRNLKSQNKVPALRISGSLASVVLIDSELNGLKSNHSAIKIDSGKLFIRNVTTKNYESALTNKKRVVFKEGSINEYTSSQIFSLFLNQSKNSLNLPIEETPVLPWEQNLENWACVNDFGARGDGKTDDTKSIQYALNSGKPVVFFQPGRYVIDSTISVPAEVQRINFMYGNLIAGENLRNMKNQGAFKIFAYSEKPLLIENLFAWERWYGAFFLIDHASTRTVVLKDLHTQVGSLYKNSVRGGKLFIENICTTDENPKRNCFIFRGQQVWARQLNPERANPEVLNDDSSVWILGFKTESDGTSFKTINGGYTEVLGGVINCYGHKIPSNRSAIINQESNVSIIAASRGPQGPNRSFEIVVRETQNDITKYLMREELPIRYDNQFFIPLYIGRSNK
jgi:hypothetical protein